MRRAAKETKQMQTPSTPLPPINTETVANVARQLSATTPKSTFESGDSSQETTPQFTYRNMELKENIEPVQDTFFDLQKDTRRKSIVVDAGLDLLDDNLSTSEGTQDDLLKINAKGFCGMLERIPMFCKLLLMTVVSLAALLLVSIFLVTYIGIQDRTYALRENFVDTVGSIENLVQAIINERRLAVMQVAFYNQSITLPMSGAFTNTTLALQDFQESVVAVNDAAKSATNKDATSRAIATYNSAMTNCIASRDTITQSTLSQVDKRYELWIESLIGVINRYARNLGMNDIVCACIITTIRLEVSSGAVRMYAAVAARNGFNDDLYDAFVAAEAARRAYLSSFQTQAPDPILAAYTLASSSETVTSSAAMVDSILADSSSIRNYTFTSVYANMTVVASQLKTLEQAVNSYYMISSSSSRKGILIATIIVTIFALVLFFIALGINIATSYTITSPWKRLNKIQSLTMKRYVPTEFLKLMNCKNVVDVERGRFVRRKVGLLCVKIRDFDQMANSMGGEEILSFLNDFYDHVCPAVRRSGFVDNYTYGGFSAVLHDEKAALNIAWDIQHSMRFYNRGRENPVRLTIVVHGGKATIGAVGDSDRISGAVLSAHVSVTNELMQIGDKMECTIVTIASNLRAFKKSYSSRVVGRITLPSILETEGRTVDVLDVFDPEYNQQKDRTRGDFARGVELLASRNYTTAKVCFTEVLMNDSNDKVARQLYDRIKQVTENARVMLQSWKLHNTLQNPIVLAAFERFSATERSSENIQMWRCILDWTKIINVDERKRIAEHITNKFFFSDTEVNVNEKTKQVTCDRINQAIVEDDLFKDVQNELEIVMNDTHKRFKETVELLNTLCYVIDK